MLLEMRCIEKLAQNFELAQCDQMILFLTFAATNPIFDLFNS